MAKRLFVGGLSWDTTDESLKAAFAPAGAVESASVITDRMSGRSKGFGFVEMTNDEEALAAIELLNGKQIDGRVVTVNEARPMAERAPKRDFDRGGSSDRAPRADTEEAA